MPRTRLPFCSSATTAGFCALTLILGLAACSPALNWREVRPEGTRLSLLLPCKPDKTQKTVPLGGPATPLSMLGCDADGATFAVAVAELADAAQAAPVLAQWQALTLAHLKAGPAGAGAGPGATELRPLQVPGAAAKPAPVATQSLGQRADGRAVTAYAAYFAQGKQLFQVVLYADQARPDAAETFFSSLKFE